MFRPDADRLVIDGETYWEAHASIGPTAGGTGLPAARLDQGRGAADLELQTVPRFDLVIEKMEARMAAEAIADFTLVSPAPRVTSTQHGKYAVWSLSRKRAGRRRILLVCEVEFRAGCKILWLEIEPLDNGHVSSVALLALGRDPSAAGCIALNTSISKNRNFDDLYADTCLPVGAAFWKWRHRVTDRPLDAERAVKVMSDFTAKV